MPADVYLLDCSDSMNDDIEGRLPAQTDSKWKIISSYDFPDSAEIYVFNSMSGVIKIKESEISQQTPGNRTPLWDSIYQILEQNEDKTITILTDGLDTTAYTETMIDYAKDCIAIARQIGTKLSFIKVHSALPKPPKKINDINMYIYIATNYKE